jgi:hypothetical protein
MTSGSWKTTRDGRDRSEVALGLEPGMGAIHALVAQVKGTLARAVKRVNRRSNIRLLNVLKWKVRWRCRWNQNLHVYLDVDVDGPAGLIRFHPLATYDTRRQGSSYVNPLEADAVQLIEWNIEHGYTMRVNARAE